MIDIFLPLDGGGEVGVSRMLRRRYPMGLSLWSKPNNTAGERVDDRSKMPDGKRAGMSAMSSWSARS